MVRRVARNGLVISLLSHWEASWDTRDKFSANFPFFFFFLSLLFLTNCSEYLPQEKEIVPFP